MPKESDEEIAFAVAVTFEQFYQNRLGMARQLLKNNKAEILSEKPLSYVAIEFVIKITTQQAWILQHKVFFFTARSGLDLFIISIVARMKKLLVCDMESTSA